MYDFLGRMRKDAKMHTSDIYTFGFVQISWDFLYINMHTSKNAYIISFDGCAKMHTSDIYTFGLLQISWDFLRLARKAYTLIHHHILIRQYTICKRSIYTLARFFPNDARIRRHQLAAQHLRESQSRAHCGGTHSPQHPRPRDRPPLARRTECR